MSNSSSSSSGGIGILGLLGVTFVILKILGVKPIGDWSWWWVTAPFWGGFALALVVLSIVAIIALWVERQ